MLVIRTALCSDDLLYLAESSFSYARVLEFRWASKLVDLSVLSLVMELHPESLPALSGALHSPTVDNKSKINIQDIQKGSQEAVSYVLEPHYWGEETLHLCELHLCLRVRYVSWHFQVSDSLSLTSQELPSKCSHIKTKIINEASTVTCSFVVFVSKCSVQTILFLKRGNSCYAYKDPAGEVVRELMHVWTALGVLAELRDNSERYNPQTSPGLGYQKMRKGNTKSHIKLCN